VVVVLVEVHVHVYVIVMLVEVLEDVEVVVVVDEVVVVVVVVVQPTFSCLQHHNFFSSPQCSQLACLYSGWRQVPSGRCVHRQEQPSCCTYTKLPSSCFSAASGGPNPLPLGWTSAVFVRLTTW